MKIIETKDEFDQIIKNANTLVVVDFFATWCGPCRMIAPQLETWAEEFKGQVAFYKVDVDENDETATSYEIQAMPTFIFFKDGEKIQEVKGANKEVILAAIKKNM